MKNIRFFDTTMRDGEQGIGYLLTSEQKLRLLRQLIRLNVEVIELGMVTDEESAALFNEAAKIAGEQNIAALCRLNEKDIENTVRVLTPFKQPTLNLLCIGSELHLEKKMFMSQCEALNLLSRSLNQVHETGFHGNVYAILEDATRGSESLLRSTVEHLLLNGVRNICFADTVGAMTPSATQCFFGQFVQLYPSVNFGAHFHNDLGLAVANTIAAVDAGVSEVQVTLGGIGERCGNASFEEIIAILEYCKDYKGRISSKIKLRQLIEVCRYFYKLIGKPPHPNKPLIGANAFSTCAGIHQSAILKFPETYEFIDPECIGLKRSFHFNRLSSSKLAQRFSQQG